MPSPATRPASRPASRPACGRLERFVVDSPFAGKYRPPAAKSGKQIWARSILWQKAPQLVVEQWLTDKPETAGKFVLIEFWATWCPPCRRSIELLNRLHEKFGRDLVVIGISDQPAEAVRRLKKPAIHYYSAIDTKARMKKQLGVFGIPHAILIEPGGTVIWEGFPLLKGHELTEKIIERAIAIGRKTGALKPHK
ncbi:MAG: TlpA family protein disulfide reductase [Planctomycetes bacterium]|nr:TlpA family protein disulfide reductase [Planctomycetota bacterium]